MKNLKNILICQYSHIEGYPPTFNAINILAKLNHKIIVLSRKDLETKWKYPKNITLNFIGNYKNRFEYEETSKLNKITEFCKYLFTLKTLIKKNKIDIILLYDNIPLLAYRLIRFFISDKHKVWYHNHDIHYLKDYKKYSLPYFAFFSLKHSFHFINYFSLPAVERLKYFNLKKFKGKQFVLPNYPPKYLFKYSKTEKPEKTIKLIYPGSNISHMHGIEDIIPILKNKIAGKTLSLTLIGTIKEKYKQKLLLIARKYNTEQNLFFINRKPYVEMQKILINYDIGVAINKPMNITYETGGTAANKIYEFPASGLPGIFFDNKHYHQYFDKYDWAFFSNLSEKSLLNTITLINENYLVLSEKAKNDFFTNFNFETVFMNALISNNILT